MLSEKVSQLSITFTLDISPDSAPYSISGDLPDRRQPKSEVVLMILPLVRYVPAIIT
jgi:hypothetical protein